MYLKLLRYANAPSSICKLFLLYSLAFLFFFKLPWNNKCFWKGIHFRPLLNIYPYLLMLILLLSAKKKTWTKYENIKICHIIIILHEMKTWQTYETIFYKLKNYHYLKFSELINHFEDSNILFQINEIDVL